jgi:hypothetical protein
LYRREVRAKKSAVICAICGPQKPRFPLERQPIKIKLDAHKNTDRHICNRKNNEPPGAKQVSFIHVNVQGGDDPDQNTYNA